MLKEVEAAVSHCSQRLRFGFLTTYSHTFFIRYVAIKHYAITKAFSNASVGPSVPEMIFCKRHVNVLRPLGFCLAFHMCFGAICKPHHTRHRCARAPCSY